MFAEKHYPEIMEPEELDAYLARGWYRMGQTIFTTHFLCFGDQFFSAIWVRLQLADYTFRKSLRKLLTKNERQFQSRIRKASLSPEKEQLYLRYKASFPGMLAPSLKDSLLDGEDLNIYNTYEIAVYDDNKLVAVSFFDVGQESAASIMGVYDPAYQRFSLGFYTMLLEVKYCMEKKLKYFYPGYVVPGYQRFDYKLRIGDVDYYDLNREDWLPYNTLEEADIPLTKMQSRLHNLQQALTASKIPVQLLNYPLFEANLFGFWRAPYFDYPMLLWCYPQENSNVYLLAVYDTREDEYLLLQCSPFDDLQFYFNESYTNTFDRNRYFMELIVIDRVLLASDSAQEICSVLRGRANVVFHRELTGHSAQFLIESQIPEFLLTCMCPMGFAWQKIRWSSFKFHGFTRTINSFTCIINSNAIKSYNTSIMKTTTFLLTSLFFSIGLFGQQYASTLALEALNEWRSIMVFSFGENGEQASYHSTTYNKEGILEELEKAAFPKHPILVSPPIKLSKTQITISPVWQLNQLFTSPKTYISQGEFSQDMAPKACLNLGFADTADKYCFGQDLQQNESSNLGQADRSVETGLVLGAFANMVDAPNVKSPAHLQFTPNLYSDVALSMLVSGYWCNCQLPIIK